MWDYLRMLSYNLKSKQNSREGVPRPTTLLVGYFIWSHSNRCHNVALSTKNLWENWTALFVECRIDAWLSPDCEKTLMCFNIWLYLSRQLYAEVNYRKFECLPHVKLRNHWWTYTVSLSANKEHNKILLADRCNCIKKLIDLVAHRSSEACSALCCIVDDAQWCDANSLLYVIMVYPDFDLMSHASSGVTSSPFHDLHTAWCVLIRQSIHYAYIAKVVSLIMISNSLYRIHDDRIAERHLQRMFYYSHSAFSI